MLLLLLAHVLPHLLLLLLLFLLQRRCVSWAMTWRPLLSRSVMQHWAMEAWAAWQPASWTQWPPSTCQHGAMASATAMACSDRWAEGMLSTTESVGERIELLGAFSGCSSRRLIEKQQGTCLPHGLLAMAACLPCNLWFDSLLICRHRGCSQPLHRRRLALSHMGLGLSDLLQTGG